MKLADHFLRTSVDKKKGGVSRRLPGTWFKEGRGLKLKFLNVESSKVKICLLTIFPGLVLSFIQSKVFCLKRNSTVLTLRKEEKCKEGKAKQLARARSEPGV